MAYNRTLNLLKEPPDPWGTRLLGASTLLSKGVPPFGKSESSLQSKFFEKKPLLPTPKLGSFFIFLIKRGVAEKVIQRMISLKTEVFFQRKGGKALLHMPARAPGLGSFGQF